LKDLIGMQDLSKEQILKIVDHTLKIRNGKEKVDLSDKRIRLLFLQPSTRTLGSFEDAASMCGAWVKEIVGIEKTSFMKGESLADTLRVYEGYKTNAIVMRTREEGFSRMASSLTKMSIINAGDGTVQHPSQALLDMVAIRETQGKINNLNIAYVGDLRFGRVAHSGVIALSHFNPNLFLVSPEFLALPDFYKKFLVERKVNFQELSRFEEILDQLDILVMLRMQREYFASEDDYNRYKDLYMIYLALLERYNLKKNLKILHPLPRNKEISPDVERTSLNVRRDFFVPRQCWGQSGMILQRLKSISGY